MGRANRSGLPVRAVSLPVLDEHRDRAQNADVEPRRAEWMRRVPVDRLALAPRTAAPPSHRPIGTGLGAARAVLGLQRAAGNSAVLHHLQRDETPTGTLPTGQTARRRSRRRSRRGKNYVFLVGDTKRDPFYVAAKVYFTEHEKSAEIVTSKHTLADIIAYVNAGTAPALKVIIVSHANEEGNLGFSLDAADLKRDTSRGDHKPRTEFKELRDANAAGGLPVADAAKIDASTQVDIRGCNIGRSTKMLDALDQAFGGVTTVTAPTHKQEYSFHGVKGKGVVSEEALFQYSIEDPGHPTVAAADRATRFKGKYPDVPAASWPALLKLAKEEHVKREAFVWTGPNPPDDTEAAVFARIGTAKLFPTKDGWVVTYKGRTTVGDMWQFEVQADRVTPTSSETKTKTIMTPIPPDPTR